MELSYTLVNLGALEQSRPNPDASRSLQLIQSSLQFNQMALVLDPANEVYREERATSLAWLSDAWLETCELGNAFDSRQQSVDIRRGLLAENPAAERQQSELAYMITGLAGVQQQIGLKEAAIVSFEEALKILRAMHEADSDNNEIEWELVYRTARLARHLQAMGRSEEAWNITHPLIDRMEFLSHMADKSDYFMTVEASFFQLDYARLLLARGEIEEGQALLRKATQEAAELVRQKPDYRGNLVVLTYSYFEYWQLFGQKPVDEFDRLLDGYLSEPERVESCSDANQAARLAIIRGDTELARRYTGYALSKGYFEAGFVSFCKAYKLCDIP
jgi:tetratricopeptide (TPR) repeat protein